ncbi:MAG TPA: hypothetical protein VD887_10410 [Allosphingosinicella sp.]|nr:hypothetical protein [Allosphingosinicella sp.]
MENSEEAATTAPKSGSGGSYRYRNDGSTLLALGWIGILGGGGLAAYGWTRPLYEFNILYPIVGGVLFNTGMMVALTGVIVRGLWFVSGEERKRDPGG